MSVTTSAVSTTRKAIAAAWAGLGLTVAATALVLVDHATGNLLAAHIQDGYPGYSRSQVDGAATIYLSYLSVVGGLGVIGWLITLWAVARRKRWARWFAGALFVVGTVIALFDLLVRDTSGDTGLPAMLGLAGLVPSLAGLALVIMLWRRSDP
jgi:hypothetical protein